MLIDGHLTRRLRSSGAAVGVAVLLVLGVGGCGKDDKPSTARAGEVPRDESPLSSEEIEKIARDVAAINDDEDPTSIEWVRTTYADAYALTEGVDEVDEARDPVVMIQIRGTFHNDTIAPPRDVEEETEITAPYRAAASIVRITVDEFTGETRIFNFTSEELDLSKVGKVESAR
jgi:hypothetical protein